MVTLDGNMICAMCTAEFSSDEMDGEVCTDCADECYGGYIGETDGD